MFFPLSNVIYKHFGVQVRVIDCQNVFVVVIELSGKSDGDSMGGIGFSSFNFVNVSSIL